MTLFDLLTPHTEMLVHRVDGPMAFRFIIQPAVAVAFSILAGLRDARSGTPPRLFWQAVVYRGGRVRELMRLAWEDMHRVFALACVLDMAYTLLVYHWIYPLQTLIVAFSLAILPYVLLRGRVAWVSGKVHQR
jgi:hypothetical protein